MNTPIKTQPVPVKTIPAKPSQAEQALKQALRQDARTHLGRMFQR